MKTVFDTIRDKAYGDVAIEEHVGLFRDALDDFADESVDLHIDGYQPARSGPGLPSRVGRPLASNGLVLMHDVVRQRAWIRGLASGQPPHPSLAFYPLHLRAGCSRTDGFDYLLRDLGAGGRTTRSALLPGHGIRVEDQTQMIDSRDETIRDCGTSPSNDAAMSAQAVEAIDERDERHS